MHRIYRFEGSRDEARDRVDEAMSRQAARHPRFHPRYEWTGPYRAHARFHVPLIRGEQTVELVVHRDRIEVRSRLPRLLRVFRSRILDVLDRHAVVTLDGMLRGAE